MKPVVRFVCVVDE